MEGTIGEVRMFAGNFSPRSWAFCEGQLQSIASNTALFSVIGTTYGGDGRTTFALPDLRGRAPIGPGTGPGLPSYREGERGGSTTNTLTVNQMPSHNHLATGVVKTASASASNDPSGNYPGPASGRDTVTGANVQVSAYGTSAAGNGGANGVDVTVGNTGGNLPINNMQPYLSVYYIICLYGTFPSRN